MEHTAGHLVTQSNTDIFYIQPDLNRTKYTSKSFFRMFSPLGLKDDRAVKQGVNKSWNQYLSRKKATKLNVHHLELKWLQENKNVQQRSQNKQCYPICVNEISHINKSLWFWFENFLFTPTLALTVASYRKCKTDRLHGGEFCAHFTAYFRICCRIRMMFWLNYFGQHSRYKLVNILVTVV